MIERIRNLPELRNLLNSILDLGLEYSRQGSWSGRSIKKGSREIRDFLFWGTSCELDSQLFYAGVCICIKLFLKYLNLFQLTGLTKVFLSELKSNSLSNSK